MCFLHVSSQIQSSDTLHPLLLSWYTCFRCFHAETFYRRNLPLNVRLALSILFKTWLGGHSQRSLPGWMVSPSGRWRGKFIMYKAHAFFTDTALRLSKLHCVTSNYKYKVMSNSYCFQNGNEFLSYRVEGKNVKSCCMGTVHTSSSLLAFINTLTISFNGRKYVH